MSLTPTESYSVRRARDQTGLVQIMALCLTALWSWVNYLLSPSPGFLICEMGVIVTLTSWGCEDSVRPGSPESA